MPRWFTLCNGAAIPGCAHCRRFAQQYPQEASEPNQAFIEPDLQGEHCFRFIEQVPARYHIAPTVTLESP